MELIMPNKQKIIRLLTGRIVLRIQKNLKAMAKTAGDLLQAIVIKVMSPIAPKIDVGVIQPTAALSSFPYTPEYSMQALKHFYYDLGNKIWGPYGFADGFSETQNWYAKTHLAIDQGPIVVMIENYRTRINLEFVYEYT